MALYLHTLPPMKPQPQSNYEEHIQQIPAEDKLKKCLTFKTVKVIKNKENLRNCHRAEEPKEKWELNVLWLPGWGLKVEKETLDKKKN